MLSLLIVKQLAAATFAQCDCERISGKILPAMNGTWLKFCGWLTSQDEQQAQSTVF
jgi:hypothetical protein